MPEIFDKLPRNIIKRLKYMINVLNFLKTTKYFDKFLHAAFHDICIDAHVHKECWSWNGK